MSIRKILVVVGTRPNFIKVTQFKKVAAKNDLDLRIVHTGQHFDDKMADVFFKQFDLTPDYFLNVPQSKEREALIKEITANIEELINTGFRPDLLIVVGDVNSTLAAANAATNCGVKLAHVESGLRSYDDSMPEEHNRVLTDKISDYFFVTEQSGYDNLIKEGHNKKQVFFIGNTMIDTMVAFEKQIEDSSILNNLKVNQGEYVLMTMHRPATVDNKEGLLKLLDVLKEVNKNYKIVFPVHPRTTNNIGNFGLKKDFADIEGLVFTEPLDYFAFQKLIKYSRFILTDSGGIQEESTFLKVPCLTLRPNTERPVTCTLGTNTLVPFDVNTILDFISQIESGAYKKGQVPPMWDGKATQRIIEAIKEF